MTISKQRQATVHIMHLNLISICLSCSSQLTLHFSSGSRRMTVSH